MDGWEKSAVVFLKNNRGLLSHLAFDETESKGRRNPVDSDSWMFGLVGPFAVDQQKIEFSKAWRRLAYKTQVFSLQFNPHLRSRQSHTQEAVAITAFAASILGLNVDLSVSTAKAHDVGHVPFGHTGERFMEKILGKLFNHAFYGAVVLQEIKRGGSANFSFEVLEGITYHSGKKPIPESKPQEYALVRLADKIAYTSHDINDAVRKGFLRELPDEVASFGASHRERTRKCLLALLTESMELGRISFEHSAQAKIFQATREWLFENVYQKIDDGPCFNMLDAIYSFLIKETENGSSTFFGLDPAIILSLMTDWECWRFYQALISCSPIPAGDLGIAEIAPRIRNKKIAWEKPDFSWVI